MGFEHANHCPFLSGCMRAKMLICLPVFQPATSLWDCAHAGSWRSLTSLTVSLRDNNNIHSILNAAKSVFELNSQSIRETAP